MFYIVGLGNPGDTYKDTRHNAGWLALDYVAEAYNLPTAIASSKYAGRISEGVLVEEEVALLWPETFMNKSGSSVKKLVPNKNAATQLIVIYDDIDLAVGEVKISFGKGAGGHNGVQSIIDALGTKEFTRIRIGIAGKSFWSGKTKRPQGGAAMTRRVLGPFTKKEMALINEAFEAVADATSTIISSGHVAAMNRFNER